MADKVKIERLFAESENGVGHKPSSHFWELAYFWAQPALFDDLAPETWDEIFWAEVIQEQPSMFEGFDWPEERPRPRHRKGPNAEQLDLLEMEGGL